MRRRSIAFLATVAFLHALSGLAGATVIPRLAGVESLAGSPFDFDQVKTYCEGSTAERDTSYAYAGVASLKVHTENESEPECSPYARGIFEFNAPNHLEGEDEFWFGAAIYLPEGFYANHEGYTDLLRVDSYVNDESEKTPFEERQEINFASWSNDKLYVRAAVGETKRDLIGPISPTLLPEKTWTWVEIFVTLETNEARTELYINGSSVGGSSLGNIFSKAAPLNRLRYGLVSTSKEGSGNLTAYFDRASISLAERGPTPAATESRISLWPLNEPSGTIAADATGTAPGSYLNGPTLGEPGILAGSTAVSFDGATDYVSVKPTLPLDTKAGVTLEAWINPDALQGSLIRRNNSYELRAQSDGSVLFRVWVGESVKSLTTAEKIITVGDIYQVVGTYDGATMKIYVNGEQVASQSQTGRISNDENTLYIGRNDGAETYFSGIIDNPTIYSEALSATTALENFERGNVNGEIFSQVPNQSATVDTSGWSTPEIGVLNRSTGSGIYDPPPYSAPASFLLEYKGGKPESTITSTSDEVPSTLMESQAYTFRFQSRADNGDVQSPTGACIRLQLVTEEEEVYCAEQNDEEKWKLHEVTFEPAVEVESYIVELKLAPEGFLGYYIGSVLFDDIELVPDT